MSVFLGDFASFEELRMSQADIFAADSGVLDGYVALRVDEQACPPGLAEDLRGLAAARWLVEAIRADYEAACYGAPVHGPLGTFDGVVAHEMPGHWRKTDLSSLGVPVWVPDARHPLGKWWAEVATRLVPLPALEILDAVLRRHGVEGSREPMSQVREIEGGWALLVHKPKMKSLPPGVRKDPGLTQLWAA